MSRKYYLQCPYCEERLEREDLVMHIEQKHSDELPEGFTPLRVVYHVANKRDFNNPRKCRICGRDTPWDERKGRYDQLCGRPECKKAQAAKMGTDMGDKIRSNSPTKSADGLEKMLASRSISRKYTWRDGTVFMYVGSYEGKLLKWMDKVMYIKSEDLMAPGPTMYYDYNGEQHIYIPDFYYIPYNLIIEVKDGGDRPNTSEARKESRLKTIAKEKHIVNNTNYNYIRLTNNDFSQLLAIFAELKMNLVEDKQSRSVHINEHMAQATMNPMIGTNDIVLINYQQNTAFCGKSKIAISNTDMLTDVFGVDCNGNLNRLTRESFIDTVYTPYIVKGVKESVERFLEANIEKEMDDDRIYEAVFGHKRYTEDQILFEKGIETYEDPFKAIVQEGLFTSKNKVSLSDFRKVRHTPETEKKYNITATGDDRLDGYYFVDKNGKLAFAALILKNGEFGKRELIFYDPNNAKASKDAPFWDELGKCVVKELKCEFYIVTYNPSNDAHLSMKDVENIALGNPKIKCLIDNGMKAELWPAFSRKYNEKYAWCLYTGAKPNLNKDL